MNKTRRLDRLKDAFSAMTDLSHHKLWFEALVIACVGFVFAWMWFSPIIWDLAPGESTVFGAISAIFFENDPHERFIGTSVDLQGTIWIFHHVDLMLQGAADTILDEIYAPIGFDLGKNTGFGWADAMVSWPLVKLIGVPGFYNAHVFLTLWTGYVGSIILFRTAGARLPLAIALSSIALTNPFTRQELFQGRPTQIYWIFHCVFLIAVLKLMTKQLNWRWGLIGGLSLAGACLVYWFGGVAVGFSASFAAVATVILKKNRIKRSMVFLSLSSIAVALALLVTWRVSSGILMGEGADLYPQLGIEPQRTFDLGFWTVPIQKVTLLTSLSDAKEVLFRSMLPLGVLALTAIGLVYPLGWRRRLPWVIGALVAIFLPLGAAFQWEGGWVVTPQAWLQGVFPPLARCGFPHRMVVAPILVGLILFIITSNDALKRIHSPLAKTLIFWGGTLFIFSMGIKEFPEQMTSPTSHLSPDYNLIKATQRWPGGVIHLPFTRGPENEHIQQMFHKQPILNGPGMDAVRPEGHAEYCDNNTVLQAMDKMSKNYSGELPGFFKADLEQLWTDGFRLIYIETRRTEAGPEAFQALFGEGLYQSGTGQLAIPLPNPNTID